MSSGGWKGGGEGERSLRAALCRGGIWRGKIVNSEIWPLFANWRLHWQLQLINLSSLHYVITRQLSIPFRVHVNAIVVSIRILIGDLIAGVGRQQRRLPRAENTLAPPLQMSHFLATL